MATLYGGWWDGFHPAHALLSTVSQPRKRLRALAGSEASTPSGSDVVGSVMLPQPELGGVADTTRLAAPGEAEAELDDDEPQPAAASDSAASGTAIQARLPGLIRCRISALRSRPRRAGHIQRGKRVILSNETLISRSEHAHADFIARVVARQGHGARCATLCLRR
jgi:hypothetical protein